MRKYLLWFRLILKRQLNYRFLLILLTAMPVCAFIVSNIPQFQENSVPQIGIYLCDDDRLSVVSSGMLVDESSDTIAYYIADSKETLIQDIINKTADCGYIFEENLTDKIMSGNFKNCITFVEAPSSIMKSLSNEMVFFAIFRNFGKDIALNYIETNDAFANVKESAKQYTDERFDYYINGPATFHVEFKTLDTTSVTNSSDSRIEYNAQTSLFPLRGILAVLILAAGLFGSVQWLTDRDNGVFVTLPVHFAVSSRMIYPFISAALFAMSSIVTLIASRQFMSAGTEISAMLAYLVLITIFSVLLSYIIKSVRFFVALIPAVILCTLICCPVFFDLSAYMPFIDVIRRFMVTFYYLLFTA